MFNLKKYAQNQITEKLLMEDRAKFDLSANEDTGTTDWLLKKNSRKNKDNTVPFNVQLGASRVGKDIGIITEKGLNEGEKVYNEKRSDKVAKFSIIPTAALEEAQDHKKLDEFRKVEKQSDKDTLFWDKYVGVQLDPGMNTTIINNVQGSQLENNPDRFDGLKNTLPITGDLAENAKRFNKEDKIEKMIYASLKNADAMLFNVYATAESENREVNGKEQNQINDINSYKARLIAFANGDFKQRFLMANKDKSQYWVCERCFENKDGELKFREKKLEQFANINEAFKAYPDINKIAQEIPPNRFQSGYGWAGEDDAVNPNDQMGAPDTTNDDNDVLIDEAVDAYLTIYGRKYGKVREIIPAHFDEFINSHPQYAGYDQAIYNQIQDEIDEGNEGHGEEDMIDNDMDFQNPGGNSALRAETPDNPRIYPCPTCGQPNKLTAKDKQLGYQCNQCADRAEGTYVGGDY